MAAAGLCHSDDHILKGDMSAPNEVLQALGLPTCSPPSAATRVRASCVKSATESPISRRATTW